MPNIKQKFLILNPDPKDLDKTVKLANNLQTKKGPFDTIIFLGDLINDDSSSTGDDITVPETSIYFTEGTKKIDTAQLTRKPEKLVFLGNIGIMNLKSGLRLGYITGRLSEVTLSQIDEVFKDQHLDLLISFQWPSLIATEEKLTLVAESKLNHLMDLTKPRYWFSVGTETGRFFERLPFSWDEEQDRITRFISLGLHGSKDRYYYAFNLGLDFKDDKFSIKKIGEKPKPSNSVLPGSTPVSEFPPQVNKRPAGDSLERPFVKREKKNITPEGCFFCLSNPNIELHLIISIGNVSYITIAKGPLTTTKPLGFSGHGIIIPINHYPTLKKYREIEEPSSKTVEETKLFIETNKYKSSLVKMFQSLGDYHVVFWEISRAKGIHGHTQFIPLESKYSNGLQETIDRQINFSNNKYKQNLSYVKITEDNDESFSKTINTYDYMLITLFKSESEQVKYLFQFEDENQRIDLQFPRRVLSFLLKLQHRMHWDKCKETWNQESDQKSIFKEKFEPFDFTLQN